MWWIPLLAAGTLGCLLLLLHAAHRRRQVDSARVYRRRFTQLVAQLELVTVQVNQLGAKVKLQAVKEPRVLDYYEGTLRLLETLLGAMRRLPPFGTDLSTLDAAVFLVRDCRQRVGRIAKGFEAVQRGQSPDLDELYGDGPPRRPGGKRAGPQTKRSAVEVKGCYFCSRPVIFEPQAEVKVKVDGTSRVVLSCKVCRDQLAVSRKLKILHFMHEGKPVHWAQMPGYQPSEEYWQINQQEPKAKRSPAGVKVGKDGRPRHLELVQPPSEAHHPDQA